MTSITHISNANTLLMNSTALQLVQGKQAGTAEGGGFLSSLTGAQQELPQSVGLFDGLAKNVLINAGIGAAVGFIPFIPGGPVIGGVLGALGGVAMTVFGNYSKQQLIKQDNQATVAALGVQTDDPVMQQALLNGDMPVIEQKLREEQAAATGIDPSQVATQASAEVSTSTSTQQAPVEVATMPGGGQGVYYSAVNPSTEVDPGLAPAAVQGGGDYNPYSISIESMLKKIEELQQQLFELRMRIVSPEGYPAPSGQASTPPTPNTVSSQSYTGVEFISGMPL